MRARKLPHILKMSSEAIQLIIKCLSYVRTCLLEPTDMKVMDRGGFEALQVRDAEDEFTSLFDARGDGLLHKEEFILYCKVRKIYSNILRNKYFNSSSVIIVIFQSWSLPIWRAQLADH